MKGSVLAAAPPLCWLSGKIRPQKALKKKEADTHFRERNFIVVVVGLLCAFTFFVFCSLFWCIIRAKRKVTHFCHCVNNHSAGNLLGSKWFSVFCVWC